MPSLLSLDCLLPNGVIVPIDSYRESQLEQVKADLWRTARDYPLFHILQVRICALFPWWFISP